MASSLISNMDAQAHHFSPSKHTKRKFPLAKVRLLYTEADVQQTSLFPTPWPYIFIPTHRSEEPSKVPPYTHTLLPWEKEISYNSSNWKLNLVSRLTLSLLQPSYLHTIKSPQAPSLYKRGFYTHDYRITRNYERRKGVRGWDRRRF